MAVLDPTAMLEHYPILWDRRAGARLPRTGGPGVSRGRHPALPADAATP